MIREALVLAGLYLAAVLLFLALGGQFGLEIAAVMAAVIFLGRFVFVKIVRRQPHPAPSPRE